MHHSPRQSARPNPAPSLTIFPASGNLSNTSATRHHQEPYEDTDTDNDSDSEDFCQASDFNPTSTQADKPPQCLAPHGWPPNYMPTQHPPRQVGPHLQPPPTRITTPISTAPHENPITQHGNQTTLTHPVLSPEDAAMAAAALNLVTTNYATTTYGTLLTTTMEAATRPVPIKQDDAPIGTTVAGTKRPKQPISRSATATDTRRNAKYARKQQKRHQRALLSKPATSAQPEINNNDNVCTKHSGIGDAKAKVDDISENDK
mmetsp:Transcript_7374/g.13649  ORF Transcript_7374/g.13649 Transcript_7374/m.13649 type:complete len:260 (-) Transcript_7374:28-807(-)